MDGYCSVGRRVFQSQEVDIEGDFISGYIAQFLILWQAVCAVVDTVQEELKEEEYQERGEDVIRLEYVCHEFPEIVEE